MHVVFAQDNLGDVFLAVFVLMNSKISGWSLNIRTMRAARRVLPPDLMAPAMRSQPRSKEMGPEERPLPLMGSFGGPEGGQVDAYSGTGRENTAFRRQVVQNILHAVSHFRQEAGGTLGVFIRGLDHEGFQIVLGPFGMVGLVAVACVVFPSGPGVPSATAPSGRC